MNTCTEEEATTKWCCVDTDEHCTGSICMGWRWVSLKADDAFAEAVRKAAVEIGDTSPSRSKAAKHVTENRAHYGLPTTPFEGFCGRAGTP